MNTAAALFASAMLLAAHQSVAAPRAEDLVAGDNRWQADLDYFAREFPAKQKDFALLTPRSRFDQEITELKGRIPQLSDQDIVFALTRLVAALNVAHTGIAFGSIRETAAPHSYPVEMRWFSDGLAVVAAAPDYQQALGCRVARIGMKTPDQVEAALAAYIPHENDAYLHCQSPLYMGLVELMQHERIADPRGHLHLTCVKADKNEFDLDVAPERSARGRREMLKAEAVLHIPEGFCSKHPGAYYWFEYLPAAQCLYIQYNKCRNDPDHPFADFVGGLFTVSEKHPVQRVIVDLRLNGGGSSSIIKPLLDGFRSHPLLTSRGHLHVLIGSQTFSSGVMAAMDFRDGLHAILIGGPTGNKPNHYGEQRNFSLPNSRLLVHYSTKHFHLISDADPSTLAPDIPLSASLNDFLVGRDPVLEAALHHLSP